MYKKRYLSDIQGGTLPEVDISYKLTFEDKAKHFFKKNKYYIIGGSALMILLLGIKKYKK